MASPLTPPPPGFVPTTSDFTLAVEHTLAFLKARYPMQLWMVGRVEGDTGVVLQCVGEGYGINPGFSFQWKGSFCHRMLHEGAPAVAPDTQAVPAYQTVAMNRVLKVGAYVGVPLHLPDGALFGTLCAIDPHVQPSSLAYDEPLFALLASLLSNLLAAELRHDRAVRRAQRAEADALLDPLTGLYNRRGWDHLMQAEETRCRRYGHPAGVLVVDLDELKVFNDQEGHHAGDALLQRTAGVLRAHLREHDIAARLGGDEFGLLLVQADATDLQAIRDRLQDSLLEAGVRASIGWAARAPQRGLSEALREADDNMFADKGFRKQASVRDLRVLTPRGSEGPEA
jgi:diguanylate cyclase (GGDEF)-like protein